MPLPAAIPSVSTPLTPPQPDRNFPINTRVYFWASPGEVMYGTVDSADHASDGSLILKVRDDQGKLCSFPEEALTKVE
ncbi:hypothetical protein HGRIS_011352 [Hohenbuehelia grisea]|uniref:Uncharacterized protein n=1 Tax=Hohenbuehelia grisea TaxID=104357 RepID=A0ABR3JX10_9AGAR